MSRHAFSIVKLFAQRLERARVQSLKSNRQVWVEMRMGKVATHVAHRKGWTLLCRVIGTEVIF